MRIGFRPNTSSEFVLTGLNETTVAVAVSAIGVKLSEVRVMGRNRCNLKAEVAGPASAAWDQVATALEATLLTFETRPARASVLGYDRIMDWRSDVVRSQGASVRSAELVQPWVATSPDSLHRYGFVTYDANRWSTYHAPDIAVLLSASFLDDHCLRLRPSDAGEVAVEFWPVPDRASLPEVRGHVWLDSATLELRRLRYRYVHLPREIEEGNPSGEVEFLKLRDGSWVISRWHIRMPTSFVRRPVATSRLRSQGQVIVPTQIKVTGGELLSVARGSDVVWKRPPLRVRGIVLDSATTRPAAGATVTLDGTDISTRTDGSGRFEIDQVLPGSYTLRVVTPEIARLARTHHTTVVVSESFSDLRVNVPSGQQIVHGACPMMTQSRTKVGQPSLLLGVVRNARDSQPLPNVSVAVEWDEFELQEGGKSAVVRKDVRQLQAVTDPLGWYSICGPPAEHRLRVATEYNGRYDFTELRVETVDRVRRHDFLVNPARTAGARSARGGSIEGDVVDAATALPLSGVEITLGDKHAISDSLGRYAFPGLRGGAHEITARKVGFVHLRDSLLVDGPVQRQLRLMRQPTQLDTVVTKADSVRYMSPNLRAFEARRKTAIGQFISEEELRTSDALTLPTLLRRFPGANLMSYGSSVFIASTRNTRRISEALPRADPRRNDSPRGCWSLVYLDGVPIYPGPPSATVDLNRIQLSELAGVEYYSSTARVPAEYANLRWSMCGVLLLWTRER
jgi:hypothetical protein